MQILHTSDWHIGRNLHGVSLLENHAAYIDHLVEVVRSERIDAVLISGDVYDRTVPPLEAVELLSDALSRLCSITRVVMTSGNHDSATRLGFNSGLLRPELSVRSAAAGVGTPVELPDSDGGLGALVYALPYLDPDLTRNHFADGGEVPARSHTGVISAAMGRVTQDLAGRRKSSRVPAIAMAHAFVTGGEVSDSERDLRVGGVGDVPVGVFGTELDYLALGHLHGAQSVGSGVVARYSGSPVAFSFSERHHVKSSVIVELGGSEVRTQTVPAPVLRRLTEMSGTLEEVLSGQYANAADSWVKVTVTDSHRPEHMRERILEHFPHALVIMHLPAVTPGAVQGISVAGIDPVEVLSEFVRATTETAPSPAEAEVLRDAYEAAKSTVA